MTRAERDLADNAPAQNVHQGLLSATAKKPNYKLSDSRRRKLEAFYDAHVMQGMYGMLDDLRKEGSWIVGFGAAPWPWASDPRTLLPDAASEGAPPPHEDSWARFWCMLLGRGTSSGCPRRAQAPVPAGHTRT